MKGRGLARRGYAMFAVLAVLSIVLISLSVFVQRTVAQERATRSVARMLQAQALAESALDRALAKLSGDSTYQGEIWQPTLSTAAGDEAARVEIRVQAGNQPNVVELAVNAQFPDHPTRRAQVSCTRRVKTPDNDQM